MVENLPAGAVYRDGDAVFFNTSAERITGYSAASIATIDAWFSTIFGEHGAKVRVDYEHDRAAGFPVSRTVRLRRRDGQLRLVEFAAFREQHREVWVLHDVTERVHAEEALRSSEAKMHRITDAIPGAVYQYRIGPDGAESFPFISRGVGELLGETADRIKQDATAAWTLLLPDDAAQLQAALRAAASAIQPLTHDFRLRGHDGSIRWIRSSSVPEPPEPSGGIVYNGVFVDVTEQKRTEESLRHHIVERDRAQQELEHRAFHDPLTDLPNRALLLDRMKQAIAARRAEGASVGLLVMDLDRFKEVNDTFGHAVGDALLLQIADRFALTAAPGETVARLGGDEFAVVLPRTDAGSALLAAERLLLSLDAPFVIDARVLSVGGSIGVALCPEHGTEAQILLQRADVAMYEAKRTSAGAAIYAPERDPHDAQRLHLLGQLRPAIGGDQLVLYYQPQISVRTGRATALEALVRWKHPQHGLMLPGEFVPLAEQSGLMRPLTEWVLAEALASAQTLRDAGHALTVAVNLSVRSLADPKLPDMVGEMLDRCGVEPAMLQLELTESAVMADARHALEVLGRLHVMGVKLAVDDFGTGYSSLAYLHRLPIDEVKIDKSFVIGLGRDESSEAIVKSTIDLAHNLRFGVVAEGVESRYAWERLSELGCDKGQGYFLASPMPHEQVAAWLDQHERVFAKVV